ncbi:phosphate ABC transporter substrate-binding protein PstS [Thiorhodococcus minor]|uniref:Phosphate-binding protein PstS n=1 Tax=Thiorhodococcus minor TaxID=57489 RepID=A0A6M0K596_9GAMM|nr:phosphate ABC transporter substrate-binding protein PstS [Thiorhodococcus minor]NEV64599.1 phosphate ABC transporter substrate-binding protein PstS [Thiorhodococcus minor]
MARAITHTLPSLLAALTLITLSGCEKAAENAPAASSAEPTMHISGAGSSFAAPMFNKWLEVYATDHPDLTLGYDSVGSGEGIDRFLAGTVDIGATDAPLRPDEADKVGGPYLQLPVTAGMIAIAYNLPGVSGPLNLPRDVYVDIFRGTLDRWDDPRLAAANPGVALPHKLIQVVARQDSSGTTFAFTNHLAGISDQWGAGVGKLIDWPGGTMVARGNEGVAGRIKITEGSIGYVEAGFAQRLHLPLAWLENRAGGFVAPNAETGQRGLVSGSDAIPDDLAMTVTDPLGSRSYPIVTYSWALLRTGDGDEAKRRAVKELIGWVLTDGQAYADALWYVSLPSNVVQGALAKLQATHH